MCPDTSRRWEYRVVEPPRETSKKEARDPTATLNEVAADGWELDETIDYVNGGTKFLVFRRPTAETDAESDNSESNNSESNNSGSNNVEANNSGSNNVEANDG